jgi:hypothetical protein
MRIAGWPFIDEGARIYFSHLTILRSYLVLVAILGLMLLLWWPRTALDNVLRSGASTDAFIVVAIGMLFCLLYLSARYGSEGYSPDSMVQIREYVTLTPVPVASVMGGKLAFALLHTLFLLALGVPFLLASLAVSGIGLPQAFDTLLVIGAAALAVRMYGLLLHTLLAGRRLARNLLLFVGPTLFLAVTQGLSSPASPIMALMSLSPRNGVPAATLRVLAVSLPFFSFSSVIDVVAACAFAGGLVAILAVVKARARKTA